MKVWSAMSTFPRARRHAIGRFSARDLHSAESTGKTEEKAHLLQDAVLARTRRRCTSAPDATQRPQATKTALKDASYVENGDPRALDATASHFFWLEDGLSQV